jgi:hypothetical protein
VYAILDRAARLLSVRRVVAAEDDTFVVLPSGRPVLEYYANSVRHLLPPEHPVPVGELLRHAALGA